VSQAVPAINLADDDYTLLGLPQTYAVDRTLLDARWRELQQQVHPDRFVNDTAQAKRLAMQWSVRINEAHRRLRDPVKRAVYLCELRGAPVNAENNTAMPTDFLQFIMGWREALAESRDVGTVQAIAQQVEAVRVKILTTIEAMFDTHNDAPQAAHAVRALMFVERFRDDVQRLLEDGPQATADTSNAVGL
jgi:molecular chaperone HscB